jgi:RNA polymerase sigma-70 factor (ECF subfamily)
MTDATRFEAFVREYQDMVFATASRLLGNPHDAEDVAQTVFLRAYERFDRLEDSPAAAGWLKTVTTNLSLNHLTRYRDRWRLFSELAPRADGPGGAASSPADAVADGAADPEDAFDAGERVRRIEHALAALPAHQRVPLVLFHFDEMTYEAIAERLGVSLGKVKTDIHRGRLALRSVLGEGE